MIVDDEQSVQNLLEKVFLHQGFKVYVLETHCGNEHLQKENPDVIILDLSVSGLSLCVSYERPNEACFCLLLFSPT